ncbi:DUF4856 domain-containing protein [Cellulophaga baltica]|uniref:DUF4856 domain-containing protein n=1 Tax=Cellulophaga TaxID=104264 RepID=UPI001C069223|nr:MULTISPECIES: DUF4856 domain-containing protein [Cellulophaga]MBU2996801.1 DUF4856 domain-containing protein [Cellulophaga baltica]MDO6768197.1 DUF4856 domain-containing protein [Cellulophaga sp. 1_MG-2023]
MNIRKISLVATIFATAIFTSCSDDSDDFNDSVDFAQEFTDIDDSVVTEPATYEFERDGNTTIDFSGQTTRLKQVNEIGALMLSANPVPTQDDFTNRFNQAVSFTDESLNGSKNVRSKTGSSVGLFQSNAADSESIKEDFDSYLTNQIAVLSSTNEASVGVAGTYSDTPRYFNAQGLEYQQAFYKGLIGALAMDQSLNHYFNRLDDNFDGTLSYRTENDAETLATDENYTTMEHHWDEAYGYVYGLDADEDNLIQKYLNDIANQVNFNDIAENVFKAFKIGRAAIVAQEYEVRDEAVEVIRYQISKIPSARAIYYLDDAKTIFEDETTDNRDAFHSLSEAYGFIYSLQFTYNPSTGEPYFAKAEVDAMIAVLEEGDGFYDLSTDDIDDLINQIVSAYDFTLEQALEQ